MGTELEIKECPYCHLYNGYKIGEFDDETETCQCRDCGRLWDNFIDIDIE